MAFSKYSIIFIQSTRDSRICSSRELVILTNYEFITKTFNFDRILPMNSGVEAGETAIKIARKWGYEKKKIESNKAIVLFAENKFWGRTIYACYSSSDPDFYTNFFPTRFSPILSMESCQSRSF